VMSQGGLGLLLCQSLPVAVEYNMLSAKEGTISAALMRKGPNLPIASNAVPAMPGKDNVRTSPKP
jgi:hypothetical protein